MTHNTTDASENVLSITRILEAPRKAVWRCWTEVDLLKDWYCPKPWLLAEADINVKAGGRFNSTMAGPEGECVEIIGSYLEVVSETRLVYTDAYSEGYMPRPESFMTAVVELGDDGPDKTKMVWSARHATTAQKQKHFEMGFDQGWSASAVQLAELAQRVASRP